MFSAGALAAASPAALPARDYSDALDELMDLTLKGRRCLVDTGEFFRDISAHDISPPRSVTKAILP